MRANDHPRTARGFSRRGLLAAAIMGGAIAAGSMVTVASFRSELARARARLADRSSIIQRRFGAIEYAEAGAGRPVLMIHGTGGGFDQGLTFAERLIERGYRVIAPSRFGYLRSDMPADASPEAQADAFVELLDALRIERIPVLGGSAGARSALAFAIRYPVRCSAIVPATHVPDRPPPPALSPLAAAILDHALKSDFWFWSGLMAARRSMIATVLATDPDLVDRADAHERALIQKIVLTDVGADEPLGIEVFGTLAVLMKSEDGTGRSDIVRCGPCNHPSEHRAKFLLNGHHQCDDRRRDSQWLWGGA